MIVIDSTSTNQYIVVIRPTGGLYNVVIQPDSVGNSFFVSPAGSDSGSGAIGDPLSLTKALGSSSPAQPGDTIYLRGGTYNVAYISSYVSGSSSKPVTIKQYQKEQPVINGTITAAGDYQTFSGLEIYNSASAMRVNSSAVLTPGLNLNGYGCKAINLVIHDVGPPGIWWPDTAGGNGTEIYGCIIWGVGIYQTDGDFSGSSRGPIIYAQNSSGSRTIENNVVFKSWTEGIKAYGENAYANGFTYKDNISFLNNDDGFLIDDINNPITNFTLQNNISYNDNSHELGITQISHNSMSMTGNTFLKESDAGYEFHLKAFGWKHIEMTDNLIAELSTISWPNVDSTVAWQILTTSSFSSSVVDRNSYYGFSNVYGEFYVDNATRLQFTQMKTATGWESSGSYHTSSLPTVNVIKTTVNRYEQGRATVTVLNWQNLNSASYDLSQIGLTTGQAYRVRDVQNWSGDYLLTGSYDPTHPLIALPLTGSTVTALMGTQTHFRRNPNLHTSASFNVFLIDSSGN